MEGSLRYDILFSKMLCCSSIGRRSDNGTKNDFFTVGRNLDPLRNSTFKEGRIKFLELKLVVNCSLSFCAVSANFQGKT